MVVRHAMTMMLFARSVPMTSARFAVTMRLSKPRTRIDSVHARLGGRHPGTAQVDAHPFVAIEVEQQLVAPAVALDPRRLSAQAVRLVGVVAAAERDVAVIRRRRLDLDVLGAVGAAEREPPVLGRRTENRACRTGRSR